MQASHSYFAYGSNLCVRQMARRCPGAVNPRPAKLSDHDWLINERGVATNGRKAIVSAFNGFITDPALKIDYHPGPKTVSQSGDIAYSTSEFTETFTDPATKKPMTIKGTNLSVWRKQADGSWKLVADSNPAAPTG